MTDTHPQPTSELDDALAATLHRSRRDRWTIIVVLCVALAGIIWVAVRQVVDEGRTNKEIVSQINRTTAGECEFFASIGETPPPSNVSKLGVQILIEARTSFYDLSCTGTLTQPSAQLIKAAQQFDLVILH